MPLLLVSGAEDPVGNMSKGVKKLLKYYQKAGMKNVNMVLFEGSRHEFLNEKKNLERKRRVLLDFFDNN